ncbi:MAG: DUF202 domain-containing protein [Betaproteobacteria bacterium]|nr:DUF202 domain-containing protein [Betaproteobacteria bacterium]
MPDPRIFFAAERTLLAWLRSGLTVMALGFVVARFGLFLTLLAASRGAAGAAPHAHGLSAALGIGLVVLGSATILGALKNHRAFIGALPPEDVPALPVPWLASVLAFAVAIAGFLLAAYLALA